MKFRISLYFESCRRFETVVSAPNEETAVLTAVGESMAYNAACLENGGVVMNSGLQKIEVEQIS